MATVSENCNRYPLDAFLLSYKEHAAFVIKKRAVVLKDAFMFLWTSIYQNTNRNALRTTTVTKRQVLLFTQRKKLKLKSVHPAAGLTFLVFGLNELDVYLPTSLHSKRRNSSRCQRPPFRNLQNGLLSELLAAYHPEGTSHSKQTSPYSFRRTSLKLIHDAEKMALLHGSSGCLLLNEERANRRFN